MLIGKIAEEAPQRLTLFFGKETVVIHLVQIRQVGKHPMGIGHLFVDVIEVAKKHLSPSVEMVERFIYTRLRHK